ncbi:hypothetical protein XA3_13470 [Xylocopilactobacillus apicola]|uniref:NAD(P)-binding domain-containing protein n=1 Tax=Xylocopilactobacillus apicola TaxID=2932184 RepID=A0AAU9DK52_9LACO|nr:hypothetical protein XA3_13470 [Xylocopilactobacillus apicola]
MKKVIILGANGQIARLVEDQLLNDDVELTLFLRLKNRVADLAAHPRVKVIEGDLKNKKDVF